MAVRRACAYFWVSTIDTVGDDMVVVLRVVLDLGLFRFFESYYEAQELCPVFMRSTLEIA